MTKHIETQMDGIISKYISSTLYSKNTSLFMPPTNFEPYEMAQMLIDIEKAFDIDLNAFVKKLKIFSFDEIIKELREEK